MMLELATKWRLAVVALPQMHARRGASVSCGHLLLFDLIRVCFAFKQRIENGDDK
jgi:hypothetical protein